MTLSPREDVIEPARQLSWAMRAVWERVAANVVEEAVVRFPNATSIGRYVVALDALVALLRKHGGHAPDCDRGDKFRGWQHCTCGWAEVEAALKEETA